jgi:hypothetical protein
VKLLITTICFLSALQLSLFSQSVDKKEIKKNFCSCETEEDVHNYFEQFENDQNFVKECLTETEESRKNLNLSKLRKISNINPITVILVKPYYSTLAKKLQISGEVLVEVFTDEKGNVVYAKVLKGNYFLIEGVKKAICKSKFTPKKYCEKLVKARHIIKYNFYLK